MSPRVSPRMFALAACLVFVLTVASTPGDAGNKVVNPLVTADSTGTLSTFNTSGGIDVSNPFFQDIGTNGRTCNSCHVSTQAWTVTPAALQARFQSSQGTDPVFRPVDGANCPSADVSTVAARSSSYSQLLSKGLFRISMPVPANAEFTIVNISDPYNCAETTAADPAFYRRPLPSTNLGFLSAVMWDGRESGNGKSMKASLSSQAIDATMGHAQGAAPTQQQVEQIVAFETALYTAQATDDKAGSLTARGATGGPQALSKQSFYLGINDVLGADPTGAAFNPEAMTNFSAWTTLEGSDSTTRARRAVARGEALFNSFPISITGVRGLNDALNQPVIQGTCTTCHDAPGAGDHSLPLAISIGVADANPPAPLDVAGLPVYTVVCNATSEIFTVTDLGRAMVTGRCADIAKTKGPILRGLAARAPYFHNGAAATLLDAVNFYDVRFNLNLTPQQKSDLVAFLQSL